MNVVAIVPRMFPSIDGVGDYALILAQQLRCDYGIETLFIVCDPTWKGNSSIDSFLIKKLESRSSIALWNLIKSIDTVLLHYVGYGYAKRGHPVWLVNGLNCWKNRNSSNHLTVMFHELYATSNKPWKSSFWLSLLQQRLAKRISNISTQCITSTSHYGTILKTWNQNFENKITIMPVFSNIGELKQQSLLSERTKRLIIFGHKDSKSLIYLRYNLELQRVCRELEITELCDIGVSTNLEPSKFSCVPIIERGFMEPEDVGALLSDSIAGFLAFPSPTYFAKSTIFAAFCAYGLIPITPFCMERETDGLKSGKNYWSTANQPVNLSLEVGQQIASEAHTWYQNHNVTKQAQLFASYLRVRQ